MGSPTGEALGALNAFVHTKDAGKQLGTFNWSSYSNPDIDRLIQEGGRELDVEKRRTMLGEAVSIMARERSHIPMAIIGSAWAMRADKVSFKPRADEDTVAMNMKPAK
jgi:peptide/nickel transport system substrate-binding protein